MEDADEERAGLRHGLGLGRMHMSVHARHLKLSRHEEKACREAVYSTSGHYIVLYEQMDEAKAKRTAY